MRELKRQGLIDAINEPLFDIRWVLAGLLGAVAFVAFLIIF